MRNIPENNLAYPVLITIDNSSSGSGFLLSINDKLYFITAKHVLFNKNELRGNFAELTCQSNDINDDSVTKYKISLLSCSILTHKIADVATVLVGNRKKIVGTESYEIILSKGIEMLVKSKFPIVCVENVNIKLLKDVLISNDVFLYGYPTSLGLKDSPQFDYNKPLLRKGIVANVYPKQNTIILDCPVYFGNSGGPVVEVEKDGTNYLHKVIGVVSQFVPFVQQWFNPPTGLVNTEFLNSGYSVAVSMDIVIELLESDK